MSISVKYRMLRVGGVRLPTTREFPWVCPEAILNRVLPEPVTKCWRILRGEKPETPVINNKSMLFVYGQRLPENVSRTFILNNRGFHSPCSQLQMKLGSFRNMHVGELQSILARFQITV